MRRALILLTLLSAHAGAAEQWTRVTTPHFELYTTAGEKKGRDLILYFEQVRSFFERAAPVKGVSDFPTRVIVFRSEKQYKPFSPNESAAAYYTQGRYRDYIVMGDADPEHLPVAIHEFMHLVIRHASLKLPLWFNEGWADLYSTLKSTGRKAMVGDLIPGRVQTLQTQKWLSFDQLTSVGLKSATYNEKDRAGIFYAESWALVHMLYLAPEYAPKFAAFAAALHRGKSAAEACQLVYGRSSAEVYTDLQAYLRRNQLFGAVFDVKLTKSEEEAEAFAVPGLESEMVLADLLSVSGKREQAEAAYKKLSVENPNKAEIAQSLGYLAWQNNDRDGARLQFQRAFAAGGRDPEMCYHFATLELEKDQKSSYAVPALRRALEAKPDYTDARLQLGLAQINDRDYSAAAATLQQIHKIDDERAAMLFNSLAYAYLESGALVDARKQAELALKWDRTDDDKRRTEDMLRYLDSLANAGKARSASTALAISPANDDRPHLARKTEPSDNLSDLPAPPAEKIERIEGIAKSFDCEGKRFVMEAEGKSIAFDMPDPEKINLKHAGSRTFEFICGPQKPFHVVVEYVAPDRADGKSRGGLRSLEF